MNSLFKTKSRDSSVPNFLELLSMLRFDLVPFSIVYLSEIKLYAIACAVGFPQIVGLDALVEISDVSLSFPSNAKVHLFVFRLAFVRVLVNSEVHLRLCNLFGLRFPGKCYYGFPYLETFRQLRLYRAVYSSHVIAS